MQNCLFAHICTDIKLPEATTIYKMLIFRGSFANIPKVNSSTFPKGRLPKGKKINKNPFLLPTSLPQYAINDLGDLLFDASYAPLGASMQDPSPSSINIREVWSHNLESEFSLIRDLIDDFPFVAMDTEFPGVTIRVLFPTPVTLSHLNYQTLRANVDLLHMIQLGLAFSDENGTLPVIEGRPSVWQFNFREFDLEKDIFDPESIKLLNDHGIDLYKHHTYGVDAGHFAELFISSGVVLNDSVVWITFHGGYDFGYLLKCLTASNLPETVEGFAELSKTFFPVFYDVKHLMRYCPGQGFHGGLNRLSDALSVERVGICHQAGSDALLTLKCFVEMLEKKYVTVPLEKYAGVLYGTGDDYLQVLKV